jgi:ribose transport system substrate-binding protein
MVKRTLLVLCIAIIALSTLFAAGQTESKTTDAKYEIALIIKATDSDFWQTVIDGGEQFDAENPDVNVTIYGPSSEAETEEAIRILENVVISKPDAIVIASQAGAGAVPAVNDAMAQGIPVITIDTEIPTDVISHLATDNKLGGSMAADTMVEFFEEYDIPLKGTVGILSAIVCDTDTDRGTGFSERMQEIAPDVTVIRSRYTDNEAAQAMTVTEDFLTSYDDLIGLFGIDYAMGEGISLALRQANRQDSVIAVSFDDTEAELIALEQGVLKALVIQAPFVMGHRGCELAVEAIEGKEIPSYVDTGVNILRKEDL